ncbi:hypothetical protein B5V91_19640, partial [Heyndrickxia sporothermodurans]
FIIRAYYQLNKNQNHNTTSTFFEYWLQFEYISAIGMMNALTCLILFNICFCFFVICGLFAPDTLGFRDRLNYLIFLNLKERI